MSIDLEQFKLLPIKDVAQRLGIVVRGNKAMCIGGHDSKTPSLSFRLTTNKWKCFGCLLQGDTIALVMNCKKCDFKTALNWLATEFQLGSHQQFRKRDHSRIPPGRTLPASLRIPDHVNEFSPDPELYAWFLEHCCDIVSDEIG